MFWKLVIAALVSAFVVLGTTTGVAQPSQVNLVVAGQVFSSPFFDRQTFVGSVQPLRQSIIGSAVEGRVGAVKVERGDFVAGPKISTTGERIAPGQVMVEIETGTLQIEIDTAKIQEQLTEQALEEIKISLPIEIDLAKARVAETEARLAYSKNEFERFQRISSQASAVSSSELAQARSQFLTDQQLHTQAEGNLRSLEGTRELRLQQAQTRLAAVRQEIIRLEDQKEKYSIRSFFDGYIITKQAEVGTWIARGDPVAEVVQLDQVDFAFTMPQDFIGRVQQTLANGSDQDNVEILVEGVDEVMSGKLLAIIPQVDMRSRLVTVRARIGNPIVGNQPVLKPGMLGRATMAVGESREMMVLSLDAVVLGGATPVVYKIVEGEKTKVLVVPVKLGSRQGSWVEVNGDLKPGDRIVVQGNERLKNNDAVVITKSVDEAPPQKSAPTPVSLSDSK
jgi:HlyD family secretion protein